MCGGVGERERERDPQAGGFDGRAEGWVGGPPPTHTHLGRLEFDGRAEDWVGGPPTPTHTLRPVRV